MNFTLTLIVWFAIGMWVYLMVVIAISKLMSLNTRRELEMMSHPAYKLEGDPELIGTCDECGLEYDIGSRLDHCGDCGMCWVHCACGRTDIWDD